MAKRRIQLGVLFLYFYFISKYIQLFSFFLLENTFIEIKSSLGCWVAGPRCPRDLCSFLRGWGNCPAPFLFFQPFFPLPMWVWALQLIFLYIIQCIKDLKIFVLAFLLPSIINRWQPHIFYMPNYRTFEGSKGSVTCETWVCL